MQAGGGGVAVAVVAGGGDGEGAGGLRAGRHRRKHKQRSERHCPRNRQPQPPPPATNTTPNARNAGHHPQQRRARQPRPPPPPANTTPRTRGAVHAPTPGLHRRRHRHRGERPRPPTPPTENCASAFIGANNMIAATNNTACPRQTTPRPRATPDTIRNNAARGNPDRHRRRATGNPNRHRPRQTPRPTRATPDTIRNNAARGNPDRHRRPQTPRHARAARRRRNIGGARYRFCSAVFIVQVLGNAGQGRRPLYRHNAALAATAGQPPQTTPANAAKSAIQRQKPPCQGGVRPLPHAG